MCLRVCEHGDAYNAPNFLFTCSTLMHHRQKASVVLERFKTSPLKVQSNKHFRCLLEEHLTAQPGMVWNDAPRSGVCPPQGVLGPQVIAESAK